MNRYIKKSLIFLLSFVGLICTMLIPIMSLGFISMWIWGTDLMYKSMGKDHPSTWFFYLTVPIGMLIFAILYVALVILPVFAKHEIPLVKQGEKYNPFRCLARLTRRKATAYSELMNKYDI
jgi:hypothetical protein